MAGRYVISVIKVDNRTGAIWLDRALTIAGAESGTESAMVTVRSGPKPADAAPGQMQASAS